MRPWLRARPCENSAFTADEAVAKIASTADEAPTRERPRRTAAQDTPKAEESVNTGASTANEAAAERASTAAVAA